MRFKIKSYLCEREKFLNLMEMEVWQWVLAAWLAFDVLIYVWAWWDDFYYSHNVKTKFRRFKEVITEE